MDLSNLRPAEGSRQSDDFRRGRGHGSGNGKTAGKGHKGQKARSGAPRPGFEGGQMPLYRRLPKRGFKNRNTKEIVGINVEALNRFEDGAEVTIAALVESGLVSNPKDGVKILGNGELTKKLTVKVTAVSEGAKAKIEAAGLTIVAVIPFFFNGVFGANVSFGGTSIIIIVGVILETLKQIESMMLVRNYKGFLDN